MLTAALALLLQAPAPVDTVRVYDSPATQALVERVIEEVRELPAELLDYRARVFTRMNFGLAGEGGAAAGAGDLTPVQDEFVSEVRWSRLGYLHQRIVGHRVQMLVPTVYSLGTMYENPWVIPHLYGRAIPVATGAAAGVAAGRATNPFGADGPEFYRYRSGDTVRVRVQGELIRLVPVTVEPRAGLAGADVHRVVGTFFLDADRAAIARARFGFTEGGRGIAITRVLTFWELENALWEGRFWLPYFQRREVQASGLLLGGAVAARDVNVFTEYEINTGWQPPAGPRVSLIRDEQPGQAAFRGWPRALEDTDFIAADFTDLRLAVTQRPGEGPIRFAVPTWARTDHLFRYNRVEGAYVGLGATIEPRDPLERTWRLYGTGGWAFAEQTARGEVVGRWWSRPAALYGTGDVWDLRAAGYRRLRDLMSFRPTFEWDVFWTFPALFGSDPRDYYDVTGAELSAGWARNRLAMRAGGRVERHDSVRVNVRSGLFGAGEFGLLAGIDPGTHTALETELSWSRGGGAFAIGASELVRVQGQVGLGDFRFQSLQALASVRRPLGIVTLAGRVDAGRAWGEVPPQYFFRFGGIQGVAGADFGELAGTTAVVGRTRALLHLPPYGMQPLARAGLFIIPPLRPALVGFLEGGWSDVEERHLDALGRLGKGTRTTDGTEGSWGTGISLLDDTVALEYVWPLTGDGEGRWRLTLVTWF
jgi:hypothetical protein